MHPAESQQHAAELRQAFLRHLPKRVDRVCRRGRQLLRAGWDINALSLLHRDAQALAGAAGRYGALEASETLYALELALQPFVEGAALPDAAQGERIAGLVQRLASLVQTLSLRALEGGAERPSPAPGPFAAATPLHRPAPPAYWRRFGLPDLERAPPAAAPAATPVAPPAPAGRPAAESAAAARPPARPATVGRRIYLLDPGEPLLSQSAQLLREEGHDVESFASTEEFLEVLGALTPDLAIVAGLDEAGLRTIGDRLRQARQRGGSRVLLMVIGERDDLPSRLAALRAGADAFHGRGIGAAELVAEVREQLRAEPADAYRVLVVEDDRSQALFAESILRNAGFETRSETDPLRVLAVLEEFEPDLILMDLYMPNVDGMELTAIIRERERFVGVPIVFLSGEQDEEKHFAALDAGGDDFLAKPIRPKHLIAAVTNRIRRARVSRRAQRDPARRDPATGLYPRPHVIDRMSAALAGEGAANGGLLFLEIEDAPGLRERLTLAGFETLSGQLGALFASEAGDSALCARFNDRAFIAFLPEGGAPALVTLARRLLERVRERGLESAGEGNRVEIAIGACPLGLGFADAGALLAAAERAARAARGQPEPLVLVQPTTPGPISEPSADGLGETLLAAIATDGLDFLYQPILPVIDRGEQIYQVLLRLRDSSGALRTAAEILPVAERLGKLLEIDRIALGRALRTIAERLHEGRPISLLVTQSSAALARGEHGAWLLGLLETRGVPGERLIIDLRAETVERASAAARNLREQLARRGVRFCLSGFDGSERAFELLELFPAEWVRLGRIGASEQPATREQLSRIVERCHRLGREVVAPRVEEADEAALAWTAGVDYIQGNFVHAGSGEPEFDFHHLA